MVIWYVGSIIWRLSMTHRLTSCTFPPARCVASWLWERLWHTDAGMHTAPVERWQVSHTWAQITKYHFQSDSRDYGIITGVYHFSLGDYFSHLWLSAFRCLSGPVLETQISQSGQTEKNPSCKQEILGSVDIFNIYICSAQESSQRTSLDHLIASDMKTNWSM